MAFDEVRGGCYVLPSDPRPPLRPLLDSLQTVLSAIAQSATAEASCEGGFKMEEVDEWVRAGKAAEEEGDDARMIR